MDLYLLECQSFGGNSWSPVFFQLSPFRKPWQISLGESNISLAWIMTGSFVNSNQIQITQTIPNLMSFQNIGIAAVTPAYKLYEILFWDELVNQRKEFLQKKSQSEIESIEANAE